MSSSGRSCYEAVDGDVSTSWRVDWESEEKDRYSKGLVSWIEIAFNKKATVTRLDLMRTMMHPKDNTPCSNFMDIEISFSSGNSQTFPLSKEKSKLWQTIKISPNVETYIVRISDTTTNTAVGHFCEDMISELRIWGCSSDDYVDHSTGKIGKVSIHKVICIGNFTKQPKFRSILTYIFRRTV